MGEKVSEYVETQTVFNNNDLFDVSAYLGVGSYESRKTLFSTLKEAIFPALSDVYTKDTNDNVFYKGVSSGVTLSGSNARNTFHQSMTAIVVGTGGRDNIFFGRNSNITLGANNVYCVFETFVKYIKLGDNAAIIRVRSGDYTQSGTQLDLSGGSYAFMYGVNCPSEIKLGLDGVPYHEYYDGANNRFVITNLLTLAVSYIGGGSTDDWASTEVTTSITAANNNQYINTANATYTDPTPAQGKGFKVYVRNGTATIGGTAYSNAGSTIWRVYHSGAWANYYSSPFNDATSSIQTQIDIARRSSIFFAPSAINPVDNTTYYFSSALGIGTAATSFDVNLGYAFRVIGATIQAFNNSGAVGSSEDSTLQLRNTTANSSSSIGTFKTNATALAQTEVTYTGLNISVAATDFFALQWDFPAAGTNPTQVFMRVNLLIQFT